jgi:hypothetical protein
MLGGQLLTLTSLARIKEEERIMEKCSFFYYSNMDKGMMNDATTTSSIVPHHQQRIDCHVAWEHGVCNLWDVQMHRGACGRNDDTT